MSSFSQKIIAVKVGHDCQNRFAARGFAWLFNILIINIVLISDRVLIVSFERNTVTYSISFRVNNKSFVSSNGTAFNFCVVPTSLSLLQPELNLVHYLIISKKRIK